jgi:hypothetical protein
MSVWTQLDEHLPSFGAGRHTPVLSTVDSTGWPVSVRCRALQDREGAQRRFLLWLPAQIPAASGPAMLLWHRHDQNFANTAALSIAGVARLDEVPAVFVVNRLTAAVNLKRNFSPQAFVRMERRAMEYLRVHGLKQPDFRWSDFDDIVRELTDDDPGRT